MIRSDAARAASLANDYGPTRGPNAPDTLTVHLFIGDPELGGLEVTDESEVDDGAGGTEFVANGYVPAALDSDDFAPDDIGITAVATFAAPVAEYPDTVTHVQLRDSVTGDDWDCVPLLEPLDITSAGDGFPVTVTVFYADTLDSTEE